MHSHFSNGCSFEWKQIPTPNTSPKPSTRWGHSSCIVDNDFYIFGGFASNCPSIQIQITWMTSGSTLLTLRNGGKYLPMGIFQNAGRIALSLMTPLITNFYSSEGEVQTSRDLTLWAHSIWLLLTGYKYNPLKLILRLGKGPITLRNLNIPF